MYYNTGYSHGFNILCFSEKAVLSVQAHVFQIDPETKKKWLPSSSASVRVTYYHDINRKTYRIIAIEGKKVIHTYTRCYITHAHTHTQSYLLLVLSSCLVNNNNCSFSVLAFISLSLSLSLLVSPPCSFSHYLSTIIASHWLIVLSLLI